MNEDEISAMITRRYIDTVRMITEQRGVLSVDVSDICHVFENAGEAVYITESAEGENKTDIIVEKITNKLPQGVKRMLVSVRITPDILLSIVSDVIDNIARSREKSDIILGCNYETEEIADRITVSVIAVK